MTQAGMLTVKPYGEFTEHYQCQDHVIQPHFNSEGHSKVNDTSRNAHCQTLCSGEFTDVTLAIEHYQCQEHGTS